MHGRTARAVSPALSHASRPRQLGDPAVLASPSQRLPGRRLLRPEKLAAVRLTSPHSLPTFGLVPRGTGGFPKGNLPPPVGGAPTPPASLAGRVLGPPLPVHAAQAATVRRPEPRFPPALPNRPRPPWGPPRRQVRPEVTRRGQVPSASCPRCCGRRRAGEPGWPRLPALEPGGRPAGAVSCRETCHRASRPVTGASAGSSLSAYGAAAAFGSCEIQMPAPGWSPPQGQLGLGSGGSSRLGLDACLLPSLAHLRNPGPVPAAVPLFPCLVPSDFLSGAPATRGSTGAGAALRGKAPLGAPAQAPPGEAGLQGPRHSRLSPPCLPTPIPRENEGRRAVRSAGCWRARRPLEAGLCSNHLGEDGRLPRGWGSSLMTREPVGRVWEMWPWAPGRRLRAPGRHPLPPPG